MPGKKRTQEEIAKREEESQLVAFRGEIDAIDKKIMRLLRERAEITSKVGAAKAKNPNAVFSRLEREADILRTLAPLGGKIPPNAVRTIYREIISACLACEKQQTICYLGPPHTFTHDAAHKHFGESASYVPADSITLVFKQLEKSLCDFAVVPFENSNEGTVGESFDALLQTPLHICGEVMLRIRHHLWAKGKSKNLANIKTIYAHPQALAQCQNFINKHAPHVKTCATDSNAAAAQWVSKQNKNSVAAIASQSAGAHYQLTNLAQDIEDSTFNTTRFFIIGKQPTPPSIADKTSVIFTVHEKAGALHHALEPLSRYKINMTKFESRPSRSKLWHYVFFVDMGGHIQTPRMQKAIAELESRTAFLKIVGSYPKAT